MKNRKVLLAFVAAFFVLCAIATCAERPSDGRDESALQGGGAGSDRHIKKIGLLEVGAAGYSTTSAEITLAEVMHNHTLSSDSKMHKLWTLYVAARGTVAGMIFLDTIDANLLVDKQWALQTFENELRRTDTIPEAKRSLLRLIGSMYPKEFQDERNGSTIALRIRADLKDSINSGNDFEAKSALLVYSRIGYFDDSSRLLGQAKVDGVLTAAEYAREISFMIPLAKSAGEQVRLVNNLFGSGASLDLISEQISMAANIAGYASSLKPSAAAILLKKIEALEPKFGFNENELGMIDAIKYANWLSAQAELRQALEGKNSLGDLCAAAILNSPEEPRKALSILISQLSAETLSSLERQGKIENVRQIVNAYEARLSQDSSVRELVSDVNAKISDRKGGK